MYSELKEMFEELNCEELLIERVKVRERDEEENKALVSSAIIRKCHVGIRILE